jgi:hypothetical protein
MKKPISSDNRSHDLDKKAGSIATWTKELLEIEAAGERKRAEDGSKRCDSMPPELKSALEGVHDVHVDIDPVSAFEERVQ